MSSSRKNKKPKLPTKKAMEHDRLMESQATLTQMDFFTEQKESVKITKNQTTLTQMDFFGEYNNTNINTTNEVSMIRVYYCSVYFIVV